MPKSEAVDLEAFVEACLQERARRVCPSLPIYRFGMEPLYWHERAEHWPDGVVRASWFGAVTPRSRSPPRSRAEAIDVAAAPVGRVTSTREDCASRYAGIGGRIVVLTLSLLSLAPLDLWTGIALSWPVGFAVCFLTLLGIEIDLNTISFFVAI